MLRHIHSRFVWSRVVLAIVVILAVSILLSCTPHAERHRVWELDADTYPLGLAWTPDAAQLAVIEGHAAENAPAYDPVSLTLRNSMDGTIKQTWSIGSLSHVTGVAFSPDGQLIAVAIDDTLRIWSRTDGTLVHTLTFPDVDGRRNHVRQFAWSLDGRSLLAVLSSSTFHQWSIQDWHELPPFSAPSGKVFTYSFTQTPTEVLLAGAIGDRNLSVWQGSDGQTLMQVPRAAGVYGNDQLNSATGLLLSPDGNMLAALTNLNVGLWPVQQAAHSTSLSGHTDTINSFAFSPDSVHLVSASGTPVAFGGQIGDRTIRLWRVADGTSEVVWKAHKREVMAVAWRPDSKMVASASMDRTIQFWPIE